MTSRWSTRPNPEFAILGLWTSDSLRRLWNHALKITFKRTGIMSGKVFDVYEICSLNESLSQWYLHEIIDIIYFINHNFHVYLPSPIFYPLSAMSKLELLGMQLTQSFFLDCPHVFFVSLMGAEGIRVVWPHPWGEINVRHLSFI